MAGDPRIGQLTKAVLAGKGQVAWKSLLATLLDVATLRELTRELGLSPKGFRIDRAPAGVLTPLLADVKDAGKVDRIAAAVVARLRGGGAASPDGAAVDEGVAEDPRLKLKEQELARLREQLARAGEGNAALRAREGLTQKSLETEKQAAIRARSDRDRLARDLERLADQVQKAPDSKADAKRRVELERDMAALWESSESYRRMIAERETQVRDLQAQVEELESLIPKSRRRKKKPMAELPEPERRFIVPYFQPGFYRCLVGKDRRSVERAMQAVFLFCTEGHAYPGLESKPLMGTDFWSIRAGIKLRVYLEMRRDGDVEVLALADREDQDTMIKRLRMRGDGS